ncbi:EpsG family protein [Myroides odoratimimus]|uniref:EpsG family protein n=1 Tax=Myroides odoratimimus TaxID=76832 RepID=UPI00257558A9|nr:EpsG family protein [Myroides odoratimimus]MDM1465224.1 EpsG family protein [Myroides odoratimimus]MDM1475232.1 EpsG family protein [Myroides odoratimimus]MDM1485065.1 EpsG family protein [Myroides odoratimimus]
MLENKYEILFNLRYNILYYVASFITFFFVIEFYFRGKVYDKLQSLLLGVLVIFVILLFGTRGEFVGIDTFNNIKYFTGSAYIKSLGDLKDIGIYFISVFASLYTDNIDVFLTMMAILYVVPIYKAIHKMDVRNPLIFFMFLFSLFFFKTMGMNTIRQGIAFSIFLYSLIIFLKGKKAYSYILFILSFFFHASIIIPIIVFFIAIKVKKLKLPFIVYIVCTILSILNFKANTLLGQIPIVNILVEERLESYYIDKGNYRIGFRADFWLFNTIFAVIGFVTFKNIKRFRISFINKYYYYFYVTYLFLSSFFFLMFSARFSDRFGFLSWMFIPLLLLPYAQDRVKVGLLNTLTVFLICVFLATIFKFI